MTIAKLFFQKAKCNEKFVWSDPKHTSKLQLRKQTEEAGKKQRRFFANANS